MPNPHKNETLAANGRQSRAGGPCRGRWKLMVIKMTIAVTAVLAANLTLADIAPFTSDGCSAFPDGTIEQKDLWLKCCKEHDFAYWKGGTYREREIADQKLRSCVAQVGEPEIATLMLMGVRVGGTPYLPTKFRWGYGWPYFRGYKEISEEELRQIELQRLNAP